MSPLREDPACTRYDPLNARNLGIYPVRPCRSWEVGGEVAGYWVRNAPSSAPSRGVGTDLHARYRAEIPLLVELEGNLLELRGGVGRAHWRGVHAQVALDLRGLRLGVGAGRIAAREQLGWTTEAAWVFEGSVRIGASDGLHVRFRLRHLPTDERHGLLDGKISRPGGPLFVPDLSIQIPLYPMKTYFKHFLRVGYEKLHEGFLEAWIGTVHQVVRKDWGGLFLFFRFRLVPGRVGLEEDDFWIARGLSVGLQWRGRTHD